jgi:hypothetical protein
MVSQHIDWLNDHGFSLWYDDGLSGGSRWNEEIAEAITHAGCVLFFVSKDSTASKYCLDEIQFAKSNDINILPVRLDSTELPPGLRLSLGAIQILNSDDGKAATRKRIAKALSNHFLGQAPTQEQSPQLMPNKASPIWFVRGLALAFGLIAAFLIFR